ncbi:MAG TPA: cytochrome c biogenesis protein CcsA, partial [Chitinophagales bacterium]
RNEMQDAPVFQRPEYLSLIADGNGLNPLLQNYWMTIHPPVLFLGFASTLIPFAYAIAALWRKDFDGWVKPALPWALFSVGILGTGILMGGAWAYESLSFGGFWAWDPVENMSFVPWLLIVAGVHLHLVYRYTKHGLFSAFLFYILGWLMVLYSTFLTRSGILGDTSVHAFTDLGMSGQLLIYMGTYFGMAIVLLALRYKSIPSPAQEEDFLSREFWMFIGALVLLLSAVQMVFTTSIPVWNKLFDLKLAPPKDVVSHYNNIQIWLALIVAVLTATIQFFAYKSKRVPSTVKWAIYSFALAVVLSIGISLGCKIDMILKFGENRNIPFFSPYFLFLIASVYAVFGNLFFFFFVIKRNWKVSGGTITHFGFGLFLVGCLISQYKKEVVSLNTHNDAFGQGFDSQEQALNVLLQRDSVYAMNGYNVTYTGKTSEPHKSIFNVRYEKKENGKTVEDFTLQPNLVLNPRMGDAPNPSTKHYFTKDIFTHITAASDNSKNKDTLLLFEKAQGDTFFTNRYYVVFESVNAKPKVEKADEDKIAVAAHLKVGDLKGFSAVAEPLYLIDKNTNEVFSHAYTNNDLGLAIDIQRINPETKTFLFAVKEKEHVSDFVIMKAIVFPFINLVWLGGIITFIGVFFSAYQRRKQNN